MRGRELRRSPVRHHLDAQVGHDPGRAVRAQRLVYFLHLNGELVALVAMAETYGTTIGLPDELISRSA
jgi:hypothetical protein